MTGFLSVMVWVNLVLGTLNIVIGFVDGSTTNLLVGLFCYAAAYFAWWSVNQTRTRYRRY